MLVPFSAYLITTHGWRLAWVVLGVLVWVVIVPPMAILTREVGRSDVEICLHGMPAASYGGYRPTAMVSRVAVANRYAVDFMMNAQQAEREGYDAFAIAHLPDLGLRECRSLVDIPVVALGG
ncbi:MAG: hypothetical protein Q7O66_23500 [Dehalococcoidia bacterium]|nr:hypothetical protein [Dehalococcoidia bacterium]